MKKFRFCTNRTPLVATRRLKQLSNRRKRRF